MAIFLSLTLALLLSPSTDAVAARQANPPPGLANAGFESPRPLEGWEIVTYGATSGSCHRREVIHEGRQSITGRGKQSLGHGAGAGSWPGSRQLVSIHGLGQDPWAATPGCARDRHVSSPALARARACWQRARTTGATPTGPGLSWFSRPSRRPRPDRAVPGRVRQGARHGLVRWPEPRRWSTLRKSPAVITREGLADRQDQRLQYGQFIEYLCDLVPGMWAEKL